MIQIAVVLIVASSVAAVFLGLAPLASGNKGSIYIEGRLPGVLWLAWTGFKIWAVLKLGGWV